MKKIFLLLLFVTTGLHAQIQKMSELSKNLFLDSKIIYEENGEDVWGYLLLNKVDKVSKIFLELEYIILDKNLNKIGSNTFQQDHYDSWIVDILPKINSVYKNKNELVFAIGFDYDEMYTTNPYAFRKINLDDFSISNTFLYFDNTKIEDNNVMDRLIAEKKGPTFFNPIKKFGFLRIDSHLDSKKHLYANFLKRKKNLIGYTFFNLNFEKKWDYVYAKTTDVFEEHFYLNSNEKFIVFLKTFFSKKVKNLPKDYYSVLDINDGKELFSIPLVDEKYHYSNSRIIFENDKIIFFNQIYEKDEKGIYHSGKCVGHSKRVFDIKSKSIIENKIFLWESISKFKEIGKYGEIDKADYIKFLDFKITTDGKTIIIGEGFELGVNSSKVKNIYTLVLDPDFNLIRFNEIFKVPNKLYQQYMTVGTFDNINLFDFMYSQEINNDEFVYFYKNGTNNNKTSALGVIVYADGKFKHQSIKLNTENGKINPIKAKKGFIILQEISDKNENSIRLEKIEY